DLPERLGGDDDLGLRPPGDEEAQHDPDDRGNGNRQNDEDALQELLLRGAVTVAAEERKEHTKAANEGGCQPQHDSYQGEYGLRSPGRIGPTAEYHAEDDGSREEPPRAEQIGDWCHPAAHARLLRRPG